MNNCPMPMPIMDTVPMCRDPQCKVPFEHEAASHAWHQITSLEIASECVMSYLRRIGEPLDEDAAAPIIRRIAALLRELPQKN